MEDEHKMQKVWMWWSARIFKNPGVQPFKKKPSRHSTNMRGLMYRLNLTKPRGEIASAWASSHYHPPPLVGFLDWSVLPGRGRKSAKKKWPFSGLPARLAPEGLGPGTLPLVRSGCLGVLIQAAGRQPPPVVESAPFSRLMRRGSG